MIGPLANTRIWVAVGSTDMRCGFDGLAAKVQTVLAKDPFSGHIFVSRGKRGDLIKCLYWRDGGLCLFANYLASYYNSFNWMRGS
jgi:transposase